MKIKFGLHKTRAGGFIGGLREDGHLIQLSPFLRNNFKPNSFVPIIAPMGDNSIYLKKLVEEGFFEIPDSEEPEDHLSEYHGELCYWLEWKIETLEVEFE